MAGGGPCLVRGGKEAPVRRRRDGSHCRDLRPIFARRKARGDVETARNVRHGIVVPWRESSCDVYVKRPLGWRNRLSNLHGRRGHAAETQTNRTLARGCAPEPLRLEQKCWDLAPGKDMQLCWDNGCCAAETSILMVVRESNEGRRIAELRTNAAGAATRGADTVRGQRRLHESGQDVLRLMHQ